MDNYIEMRHISKVFPGVKALDNVSFSVSPGEVHGLIGENGAGKSTLMKILSGAYKKDEGEILINNEIIDSPNPKKMIDLGVSVIYQEMTLLPHLSIAENLFLGNLPKTKLGLIDWKTLKKNSLPVLSRVGLNENPYTKVKDLNVAKRQLVEISKALTRDAKLIVLDEPSAVLGGQELDRLYSVIHQLTKQNIAFIYISHRLSELFEITERVTVLKDGQYVGTERTEDISTDQLIRMMVGREVSNIYPEKRGKIIKNPIIKVKNLSRKNVLKNINFEVNKGEILGIAGLEGAGRTELLRALFGVDSIDNGDIYYFDKKRKLKNAKQAIKLKIGFLPEERKQDGLMLNQSGKFNTTIPKLKNISYGPFISLSKEKKKAEYFANEMQVRPPNVNNTIRNFSGGNQQKFMFSRWLYSNSEILFIDEPTRGVDVGAKKEIYRLILNLAKEGVTILMVSSELPEIIGMSDRVLVMREGELAGELPGDDLSEEKIMSYAVR
ncbi:sugar ABC transporter ATP-binding protein [Oceanobacillus sojae]|uniref:sugar ABC transporter ATP-binding protein n=1 Tax=Oceanobacillus sojae TaxID=582851 RepID=UPI001C37759F|nr:sugar ABC transporter ATP-binding protein [Oceanobacillus sojae]